LHNGFAFVDIIQPCVTFNPQHAFDYYNEKVYYLDDKHDPKNKLQALEKALEWEKEEKFACGIFYQE